MFVKKNQDTALKVEYDGDFRICCCLNCCKRWYFTFNGLECSNPMTIEAIDTIITNHGRTDTNVHKHSQIGGYCEGIGKGTVRVGLVVGIAQVSRAVLMRILGTTQWLESLSRKSLSHSS